MKKESVSMPLASAGIVGLSPDVKIGGVAIEPKMIVAFATIFVMLIKVLHIVTG